MSELATANASAGVSHADRIHQVREWIIQGFSEHDIAESIAKLWPKQKSVPLIASALKSIRAGGEIDEDLARGWVLEAMRLLYVKALETNDLGTALKCVKEIAGMHGI